MNQGQETTNERPFWLIALRTAKAEAWANLPPAERAVADAAHREWRQRKDEKRRKAVEDRRAKADTDRMRMRFILARYNSGMTAAEIGAEIGLTGDGVIKFAQRRGVLITNGPDIHRALMFSRLQESALRRMADDCGEDPTRIVAGLVALLLTNDARVARTLLAVRDKPLRAALVVAAA